MNFIIYVGWFVAALGLFTYFCIPKGRYKGAATAVFVLLASGAFALSFETAGQPKPVEIEWRSMRGLRVVGFMPDEEAKLVYVWAIRNGSPMAYAYPWKSDEEIEKLQDAWRRSKDTGGEFYLSNDGSEIAEVRPEPQMRPKQTETAP